MERNSSLWKNLIDEHPVCTSWKQEAEGAICHLASILFVFLDSPEWDSLRPTEEGIFQVTLTAETDCRYVSWRRKKLYLLLAQHRYISRLFSVLIGSDIADKLYALNDRVYIGKRYHYDIRLPNFYQMSSPEMSRSPLTEQFRNSRRYCDK